eukprot:799-Heterococcus_DN1.PRE.2
MALVTSYYDHTTNTYINITTRRSYTVVTLTTLTVLGVGVAAACASCLLCSTYLLEAHNVSAAAAMARAAELMRLIQVEII